MKIKPNALKNMNQFPKSEDLLPIIILTIKSFVIANKYVEGIRYLLETSKCIPQKIKGIRRIEENKNIYWLYHPSNK